MNINGIGTAGYPAWQGARRTQQNAAGKSSAESVNNVADAKPHTSIVYRRWEYFVLEIINNRGA